MADRDNERDDSRGGLGLGGAQDGPIGGNGDRQEQSDASRDESGGTGAGELGQGQQRHSGGSSRDSEKLG
jgi:hypothetical protein